MSATDAPCPSCGAESYETIVNACPFCGKSGCAECMFEQGDVLRAPKCCDAARAKDEEWWTLPLAERLALPESWWSEPPKEAHP